MAVYRLVKFNILRDNYVDGMSCIKEYEPRMCCIFSHYEGIYERVIEQWMGTVLRSSALINDCKSLQVLLSLWGHSCNYQLWYVS